MNEMNLSNVTFKHSKLNEAGCLCIVFVISICTGLRLSPGLPVECRQRGIASRMESLR